MAMLNRTADLIGRNVTPLSPALLKLEPEQRLRLLRSTQKVGKVLGTTPTLDVISPSASAFSPVTPTPLGSLDASAVRRKPSFILPRSPAAFIHSVTSRASVQEEMVKSPVVRYRLADRSAQPVMGSRPSHNILRRAHIPAALNLPQPRRNEASPLSPFRYNVIGGPPTSRFSPLPAVSPFSPFSPITEQKIEQRKLEKLEKLDKLARCKDDIFPPEFIYPSLGQVSEKVEKISSYLDLYRMGAKDDSHLPRTRYEDQEYISVRAEVGDPDNTTRSRPVSRGLSMSRRRSRSVGDFHSFAALGSSQAEAGSGSRFSIQMNSLAVQSPSSAVTRASYFSPSVYSDTASFGVDSAADVAALAALNSPRKRACSIMSAKQSILGADAKLMAEFRTRFGTRPLDFHFPPFPAPTCPLPSPPVSPTLEQVKSPKVPYWVKSSFRPHTSGAYALGFPDVGPYAQVKSASTASRKNGHLAPPATPRTRRVERRQGWGGHWNQGTMGGVIDQLRQL
ncbi:hypothetical protein SCP_0600410 [Sparassis crispa]|uniref:Uncharacterized protein n=1 Tax=Sparassis crispa TaxID=139825 RepID=A0A401GPB5_9APHY|nr:hypothetical protein SCP_0600410 [Sparassis crispa]GBE84063.1 hypothetical protein SCP_0600410 [Sparassis crispa]